MLSTMFCISCTPCSSRTKLRLIVVLQLERVSHIDIKKRIRNCSVLVYFQDRSNQNYYEMIFYNMITSYFFVGTWEWRTFPKCSKDLV